MLALPFSQYVPTLITIGLSYLAQTAAHSEWAGQPAETRITAPAHIPMDDARGKITVQAMINGKGPFSFLVDTGAGITVVNADFAKEIGLKELGEQRVGDPSNPEAIAAQRVRLDSIKLGDVEFRDVGALTFDRAGLYGDNPPKGVLGFPLFSDCLLTLNYPAKSIDLAAESLPPADGRDVLDFEIGEGGIPEFEIEIGGQKVRSHIDSGAMSGVAVAPTMEGKLALKDKPVVKGRGRTVNSEFEVREATLDGNVRIGGHVIENPKVSFHPVIRSANLGHGVLQDFIVSIDQKNKRLRFAKPGATANATASAGGGWTTAGGGARPRVAVANPNDKPRVGVALSIEGDAVRIAEVLPGFAAEKAGLKAGDLILSVNGKPATGMDQSAMGKAFRESEVLTLEIDRTGEKHTVRIDLKGV